MTAVQNARDAALESLLQTSRGGWSDGSLKRTVQRAGLDSRDAALCSRLVYGVVQNRALLDYYIDHWCTQRANHLEPVVAYVLRLGVYQILFMDKIPERAAVNEAVEQVKRWGRPRAAGMVNAVLRKCVASKNALPPLRGKDDAALLSLQYSHPRWLVERLIKLLGREETEQLLALHNQPVPTVIQTNPLKTTPAALRQELEAAGAEVTPHPWLEGCFTVTGTGDLEKLPAFTEGRCTVQDAAARLVSLAAAPDQHARVLDVCAAPGGKSFALAMDMAAATSSPAMSTPTSSSSSKAARSGWDFVPSAPPWPTAGSPTPPGWVRPTWWWRTCPAPALASSAKSRTSATKTPRSYPSSRPSKRPFWTTSAATSAPAACWCTPPAPSCRRRTRIRSPRSWPPTPNLKKRPSRCRASAAVTALSPSIPTVPARTASSSAVCAAARQHYDRHQIHDGSGADRLL